MVQVRCKTCDQGLLSLQKVHRMSGPAVTIGYILLIPSILGILFSGLFFIVTLVGAASVAEERLTPATIRRLQEARVPASIIADLKSGKRASDEAKQGLTSDQLAAVAAAESQLDAHLAASGCFGACGTGMAVLIAVLSFVGGLVGWLLVMKKRVLVCSTCSAVTSAS